ncbi:hypothetical protein HMI54_005930 [Coelomomyces lativittatus]|nr:hypothetical protein HMI56_001632 [Coelomomyces lativittatus]KAJ1505440.1 hypothetical protein HMI54_005930 [Coelomomyces lativittatus]KAJ1512200.1 hypothetical protein HMI55_006320 [Coelomomyces lativittatus]
MVKLLRFQLKSVSSSSGIFDLSPNFNFLSKSLNGYQRVSRIRQQTCVDEDGMQIEKNPDSTRPPDFNLDPQKNIKMAIFSKPFIFGVEGMFTRVPNLFALVSVPDDLLLNEKTCKKTIV